MHLKTRTYRMILPLVAFAAGSPCSAVAFAQEHAAPDEMTDRIRSPDFASEALMERVRLDFGALQDTPATIPEADEDDWRVDAIVWMLLTSMSGDARVGPIAADVDASFGDILDASDSLFAFSGRLEIAKGRWGGYINGMYTDLGAEDQTGILGLASVDVTAEIAMLEFGAIFRAFEEPASNGGGRDHSIDVFAGGRYQSLSVTLDPSVIGDSSRQKNWIDPIVGARAIIQLGEHWDFIVYGDIGGFGVGSDLTWAARAMIGYHFEMFDVPTTLYAGYAAMGTDYSDGDGLRRFEWDMILHGPVFGLAWSF